ncbi:MAG: glutathione S-transferase N-terminal domain-containing protein, partial [Maritimibacter sp.]|nr:glutathione S-transferase N-terminal domain-containing protein [Maritimibacter sp.]
MPLKLHNYFRSSTSTRLRAALNLKGLAYDYVGVHLVKGEHRAAPYTGLNPQKLVPALELEDGTVLIQSLAIMEWLDEAHPEPPLLPEGALARARVRALGQMIALDIHPVNNLRVMNFHAAALGGDETAQAAA